MLDRSDGFRAENLDFLGELEFLTGLVVTDGIIRDIKGIEQLPNLEHLELRTYAKTALDFGRFPKLRTCHIDWIAGSESIFDCTNLEKLEIWRFPTSDMRQFDNMLSLRSISISQGNRLASCDGIERCAQLADLSLAYLPNLRSFDAVALLREMEMLSIETCRGVTDLEFLRALSKLHTLVVGNCGEVRSLTPLAALDRLRRVEFWESTNVEDGDLGVLLELPLLTETRFKNRRHYSHTREEVEAHIDARRE